MEQLQAELLPLAERYDVVVANPPYMGSNNMNKWLADWTKRAYPDSKRDLCTCFIERGQNLTIDRGYEALITSDTCMYISSFEQLRKNILSRSTIVCFIDTRGTNAHPDVFDANAGWVLYNAFVEGVKGSYFKLNQAIAAKEAGLLEALANPDCGWLYQMQSISFSTIPGNPISYWVTEGEINAFTNGRPASDVVDFAQGLKPGDTERFIRAWYEVSSNSIYDLSAIPADSDYQSYTWFRISNGGEYRKWYGNLNDVVNWHNQGYEIRNFKDDKGKCRARVQNERFYFKEGLTWSALTSGPISVRVNEHGIMCAGAGYFINANDDYLKIMGFLNSSTSAQIKKLLTESLNNEVGDLSRFPILMNEDMATRIERIVSSCVDLCRKDWDSFETSSSFSVNPLI